MPAQLIAQNEGPSILLDKPILLLGRHPECDIQIDSRKISRRHCCIAQVNDFLVIRDLGSTNGIRINGARVNEGRLAPGDEVTIGNHRYEVRWSSIPGEGAPAAPRRKTAVRMPPPGEVADDLLESCDDPIPLAEPGSPAVPTPRSQSPAPAPVRPPSDEVFILPDHLELMPNSDPFPKIPNPSGSHPNL
jgi:predicted component of type VI protein secretion system